MKEILHGKLRETRTAFLSRLDGLGGSDHDMLDDASWQGYVARIQAAADAFSPAE